MNIFTHMTNWNHDRTIFTMKTLGSEAFVSDFYQIFSKEMTDCRQTPSEAEKRVNLRLITLWS